MNAWQAGIAAWLDGWWDEEAGLLGYPSDVPSPTNPLQRAGVHGVRESAVYALALLERGGAQDGPRAERALRGVLAHQVDQPGSVAHGTWRRSPAEPEPGANPREWIDYDPNWREFVGTTLSLVLAHSDRLPPDLVDAIDAALVLAVEGSLDRDVSAEYTNIALMSSYLLDWAGERFARDAWRRRGLALAEEVARAYEERGAFPEHNSPTYYGVDLYGLALWRARGVAARLRELGASLEAMLWRDLARFYHAGLRNLCGPYTRAYGMDMNRYVAGLGGWIADAVPQAAPLPPLGNAVDHGHDFLGLVAVGVLGSRVPQDALAHLRAFQGPRRVEQEIAPGRVATAVLRDQVMWGGEHTGGRVIHWQHHGATLHWRARADRIGWLRLVTSAPLDARADAGGLEIVLHSGLDWLRGAEIPVWLEAGVPPENGFEPGPGEWAFPGLRVVVESEPAIPWRVEAAESTWRVGQVFAPGAAPDALRLRIRPVL